MFKISIQRDYIKIVSMYRMVAIGPCLKWLEQHFVSGSFQRSIPVLDRETQQKLHNPYHPYECRRRTHYLHLCSVKANESSIVHNSQNDSRVESQVLNQDRGLYGPQQLSDVDSIRFRRLFSHDID